MKNELHTIRYQILELDVPDLEISKKIQHDIMVWSKDQLAEEFTHALRIANMQDSWIKIDRLSVDIKVNDYADSEKKLIPLLTQALILQLNHKLNAYHDELSIRSKEDRLLDTWEFFLRYGFIPWWSKVSSWADFELELSELIRSYPQKLKKLYTTIYHDESVIARLMSQFSDGFVEKIILVEQNPNMKRYQDLFEVLEALNLLQQPSRLNIKLRLAYAVHQSCSPKIIAYKAFYDQLLSDSNYWKNFVKEKPRAAIDKRKSFFEIFLKPFSQYILSLPISTIAKEWQKVIEKWGLDCGVPTGEVASLYAKQEGQHKDIIILNDDKTENHREFEVQPEVLTNDQSDPFKGLNELIGRELQMERNQQNYENEQSERETTQNINIDPLPGYSNSATINFKALNLTKETLTSNSLLSDELITVLEEGIYIHNAGLIILHPFLAPLFEGLNLVQQGAFISDSHQQRAICICEYLVSSKDVFHERLLVLPKVMCAWPISKPLDTNIFLTAKEKEEANQLLESVIQHWSVLRNTSIETLREEFLLREGRLTFHERSIMLKVTQCSTDILLPRLPWSISLVKLPWNAKILLVEWV